MLSKIFLIVAAMTAFTALAAGPALSGFLTGRDLLETCSPRPIDPVYRLKVAECRGYVLAVADSTECNHRTAEFRWNSAMSTSQRDLVDKVVTWLDAHPALLSYKADGLVAAALSDAYPCNEVTASGTN